MKDFDLKEFMQKHNLSENEVSDITGSKVRTVKSWLSGDRGIKPAIVSLLTKSIKDGYKEIKKESPTVAALSASVSMLYREVAILKGKNEKISPDAAYEKMKEQAHLILEEL